MGKAFLGAFCFVDEWYRSLSTTIGHKCIVFEWSWSWSWSIFISILQWPQRSRPYLTYAPPSCLLLQKLASHPQVTPTNSSFRFDWVSLCLRLNLVQILEMWVRRRITWSCSCRGRGEGEGFLQWRRGKLSSSITICYYSICLIVWVYMLIWWIIRMGVLKRPTIQVRQIIPFLYSFESSPNMLHYYHCWCSDFWKSLLGLSF